MIDKHFVPCSVNGGDEMFRIGILEFNITRMLEHIHSHQELFVAEMVAVKDFFKEFSVINEEHMDFVQVSEPVILAEISPKRYNLIDGNHRMEKARRLGIETVLAYKLSKDIHIQFLTSQEAYASYVDYWNSKQD